MTECSPSLVHHLTPTSAYIAADEATIGSESVDIRSTETKLACTVPTTNPASQVPAFPQTA